MLQTYTARLRLSGTGKVIWLRDEQGILQCQVAAYLEIARILDAIEGDKEPRLHAIEVAKCELTR